MKKIIILFILLSCYSVAKSQNVGIGTTSPSHPLHLVAPAGQDPLKIENFQLYSTENSFLVVDSALGIVKHMPMDSLLSLFPNLDTIFTSVRDSLLYDTTFINWLNSLETNVDSASLDSTLLSIYEDNDTVRIDLIGLSLDSNFIKNITDSINYWRQNANGTGLESIPTLDSSSLNSASGDWAISAGYADTASGIFSTSSGGAFNKAQGNYSTSGGGYGNFASNIYSTIAGGERDSATGYTSTIAGGSVNIASGYGSSIGGGTYNNASGSNSGVSSGYQNRAQGSYSFIGGGYQDSAMQSYSAVVGGNRNRASGMYSAVVGGDRNKTMALHSFIGGGEQNVIAVNSPYTAQYSLIAGGLGNRVIGDGR